VIIDKVQIAIFGTVQLIPIKPLPYRISRGAPLFVASAQVLISGLPSAFEGEEVAVAVEIANCGNFPLHNIILRGKGNQRCSVENLPAEIPPGASSEAIVRIVVGDGDAELEATVICRGESESVAAAMSFVTPLEVRGCLRYSVIDLLRQRGAGKNGIVRALLGVQNTTSLNLRFRGSYRVRWSNPAPGEL
jgi:hypothetical protein